MNSCKKKGNRSWAIGKAFRISFSDCENKQKKIVNQSVSLSELPDMKLITFIQLFLHMQCFFSIPAGLDNINTNNHCRDNSYDNDRNNMY